jgi:hydrogenase nickel incorporation protein HypB
MFRACDLVLINKIDLLPHLDVSVDRIEANIEAVHPGVPTMRVSARTGEGLDEWREWLVNATSRAGAPA